MVELREFVRQALCEITEGIEAAQEALKEKHVTINPYAIPQDGQFVKVDGPQVHHAVQAVEFDIAITATQNETDGGGFGIQVLAAKIGADVRHENVNSSVSHVRFQVLVEFPHETAALPQSPHKSRFRTGQRDGKRLLLQREHTLQAHGTQRRQRPFDTETPACAILRFRNYSKLRHATQGKQGGKQCVIRSCAGSFSV